MSLEGGLGDPGARSQSWQVSRYHVGAFVVFARDVDARTPADPRVADLEKQLASASGVERARFATELAEVRGAGRSEKLGQVAAQFDGLHSIQRAVSVGSVDAVIDPHEIRPRITAAVEAGLLG